MTTADHHQPTFLRPTRMEVLWGWLPGVTDGEAVRAAEAAPRDALRAALLADVVAAPCFVSFSGGRDSSCVLAAATDVARRSGLPLPVPVTMHYPGVPASDEAAWQESVLRHLGLRDWIKLDLTTEADLLGPVARTSLRRRGMLWPPTAHVRDPLFEAVSGGVLLTGNGGDELFSGHRSQALARLIHGPLRGRRHAAWGAARALRPYRMRRRELASSLALRRPWLRADAIRELVDAFDDELRDEPWRWTDAALRVPRSRSWVVGSRNLRAVAAEHDVRYRSPLLDTRFVAAVAETFGVLGPSSRTAATEALFQDLLPSAVLRRRSKAWFNEVAAGAATKRFATSWDGNGVPREHVDTERLRKEWSAPRPSAATFLLLQRAWARSSAVRPGLN